MYTLTHALGFGSSPTCIDELNRCDLAQTWSLVVELTFYVALPLFVWLFGLLTRRLSRRGWMITQLSVMAGLSAISVWLSYGILTQIHRGSNGACSATCCGSRWG